MGAVLGQYGIDFGAGGPTPAHGSCPSRGVDSKLVDSRRARRAGLRCLSPEAQDDGRQIIALFSPTAKLAYRIHHALQNNRWRLCGMTLHAREEPLLAKFNALNVERFR